MLLGELRAKLINSLNEQSTKLIKKLKKVDDCQTYEDFCQIQAGLIYIDRLLKTIEEITRED